MAAPRYETGPEQLREVPKGSFEMAREWVSDHPVLTTVGVGALAAGGLALGSQAGWLAGMPLLDKAGKLVIDKAPVVWNYVSAHAQSFYTAVRDRFTGKKLPTDAKLMPGEPGYTPPLPSTDAIV